MRDFKKALRKIPLLYGEYHYPKRVCSLFLMPDGKLYGSNKLLDHVPMLIPILNKKIIDQELMDLLADAKIGRILINGCQPVLFIDCVFNPANEQITTLRDLVHGNYTDIRIETYPFYCRFTR